MNMWLLVSDPSRHLCCLRSPSTCRDACLYCDVSHLQSSRGHLRPRSYLVISENAHAHVHLFCCVSMTRAVRRTLTSALCRQFSTLVARSRHCRPVIATVRVQPHHLPSHSCHSNHASTTSSSTITFLSQQPCEYNLIIYHHFHSSSLITFMS